MQFTIGEIKMTEPFDSRNGTMTSWFMTGKLASGQDVAVKINSKPKTQYQVGQAFDIESVPGDPWERGGMTFLPAKRLQPQQGQQGFGQSQGSSFASAAPSANGFAAQSQRGYGSAEACHAFLMAWTNHGTEQGLSEAVASEHAGRVHMGVVSGEFPATMPAPAGYTPPAQAAPEDFDQTPPADEEIPF